MASNSTSDPVTVARKSLHLLILPTERCNFRCTYCYEDFLIGRMSGETQDGVRNFVRRRIESGSLEHLLVSWFGGEPLVADDIVLDMSRYFHSFYREGRLASLSGNVTTNGFFLTPDLLEELVALRQSEFQISLDGYGSGHDVTRRHASGAGTFTTIWNNLLAARATDLSFSIMLRVHLTPANAATVTELVEHLCEEFHDDPRFNVYFRPIENLGGAASDSIQVLPDADAMPIVDRLIPKLRDAGIAAAHGVGAIAESQGVPRAPTPGAEGTPPPPYVCYASKPNSFVFRADGRVGKCTVVLTDPRNSVGRVLPDGQLELDNDKLALWFRGFKSGDIEELGCPARNLPTHSEQPISLERLRATTGARSATAAP